jgi:hypothetical protein
VRLTKTPAQYLATRESRRELPYEAVLASGRSEWTPGEHVRVYRATRGRSRLIVEPDDRHDDAPAPDAVDPRDYDVEHYLRVLRDTYAERLSRALDPEDFAAVFADPEQPSLFARSLADAKPILTAVVGPAAEPATDQPVAAGLHVFGE